MYINYGFENNVLNLTLYHCEQLIANLIIYLYRTPVFKFIKRGHFEFRLPTCFEFQNIAKIYILLIAISMSLIKKQIYNDDHCQECSVLHSCGFSMLIIINGFPW